MTVRRRLRPGLLLLALAAAALLFAQAPGQQEPPPEEKKQEKKEGKPRKRVFTGKINLRSSRQEQETASYGFKGVGPDGRMEQAALERQPTETDVIKVARLAIHDAKPDELAAFLAEGNLRAKEKKP
jgi:hypothetical protein